MRLKSELWAKAYMRRCQVAGLPVYVIRRGDAQAGAIFIKVNMLDGGIILYGPAIGISVTELGTRLWRCLIDLQGGGESDVDEEINRQIKYDPDIWVIEVEARDGDALLDNIIDENVLDPD